MKIGFTGTRHGISEAQWDALDDLVPLEITEAHHGDCVGADTAFHQLAFLFREAHIYVHPPTDDKLRAFCGAAARITVLPPLPYLARNRAIVAACDLLIACPAEMQEQHSGGTWYTVRQAHMQRKPCKVIYPDGRVEDRNP